MFINLGGDFRSFLYQSNFLSTDINHEILIDFEELRVRSTLSTVENYKLKLTLTSKFM